MRDLNEVQRLTDDYLNHTYLLEDPENLKPRDRPRASTLHSCARNQYYAMSGTMRSDMLNRGGRITQEMGRLGEDISVTLYGLMGIPISERQAEFDDDWMVSGHPDGQFDAGLGFEHKVYSSYKYLKVCQFGIEKGAPDILSQGLVYADFFGWTRVRFVILSQSESDVRREIGRRKDWALSSKNPETRKRWEIFGTHTFDPKVYIEEVDMNNYRPLIPTISKRVADLTAAKANGTIPMREADPDKDKFPCIDWCNWHKKCLSDGPAGISITPSPFKED